MIYFSVPPQSITVTTEPATLYDGKPAVVICKIDQVRPFGNLEMLLVNGTSLLPGRTLRQYSNDDGVTTTVVRHFDIALISRYGLCLHTQKN